ncbi:MAG: hypothetical protein AB7P01_14615 [Bacteroidia bacterium]
MKSKKETIHIGQKIEETATKQNMSKSALARKINKTRSSIYHLYKSKSVDSDLLFEISKALKHNFFAYYLKQLPVDISDDNSTKEVERLKKELEMRDKLIALLEEKKGKK